MAVIFKLIDSWSEIENYYVQDMDRVPSENVSGVALREKSLILAPGGINLGLQTVPTVTYTAAPIERSAMSRDKKLGVGRIKLSVGDRNNGIAAVVSKNVTLLRGAKVVIRRVYTDQPLDSIESYRELFTGSVTTFAFNGSGVIQIEVSDRWFDWGASVNKRTYNKMCGFRFKGAKCQYAGVEGFCDKTLPRCEELGNEANFGGFPETVDVAFTGVPFV